MLEIRYALSGETITTWDTQRSPELLKCPFKTLKARVAREVGASRFRQRWRSEGGAEADDEASFSQFPSASHHPPSEPKKATRTSKTRTSFFTSPEPELLFSVEERSDFTIIHPNFAVTVSVQVLILDFVEPEEADCQQLKSACMENRSNEVEHLLRRPLDPDSIIDNETADSWTALHFAANAGSLLCVELLIDDAWADTDKKDRVGRTALNLAVANGHLNVVYHLLRAGARATKEEAETAWSLAAEIGDLDWDLQVLAFLLDASADPDKFLGSYGIPALQLATRKGHLHIVDELLKARAQVDLVDGESRRLTALHWAALKGHVDIAALLLKAGAQKERETALRATALHLAAENGNLAMVQLLIKAKARSDGKNALGQTAVHLAADNGYLEVAQFLRKLQADEKFARKKRF